MVSALVISTVLAYQWDMVYGTKMNRINAMQQDIMKVRRLSAPRVLSFLSRLLSSRLWSSCR